MDKSGIAGFCVWCTDGGQRLAAFLTLEYNETLLMICPHSIPYYIESSIHNFKGKASAFLRIKDEKPYHCSAVYAAALHSTSIPFRMEPVGPSADSGDVSGAMDVNGLIQMLAGQNMVAILAVSMPAPALTGKQGEQSLIGSLQSLTPDDMKDLQTVESMTVHGALGSGLCTNFHLKTRWQVALWAMAEITPN
ncbi:hypothetical protein LWI29_008642 [Acer saccharum]|uniref:Uncharacterized protein n=1 Tax=Acer saccharum TaxID=4024 RepID=A0AA39RGW9_ACESA|nr:hypothetical protein LWI29_008642 [Acer saccharum]